MSISTLIYKLPSGYLWSVARAKWVSLQDVPEGSEIVDLVIPEEQDPLEYLATTLRFYGEPLGELATAEDRIKELLKENREYLLDILILYALDIEVPEEALAYFGEIKKELKGMPRGAITRFVKEQE